MFYKKSKEKRGEELISEAKRLGVETEDIFPAREIGATERANAKLQERVRNAKNLNFARMTWIIVLISATASVISALASWFTVCTNNFL